MTLCQALIQCRQNVKFVSLDSLESFTCDTTQCQRYYESRTNLLFPSALRESAHAQFHGLPARASRLCRPEHLKRYRSFSRNARLQENSLSLITCLNSRCKLEELCRPTASRPRTNRSPTYSEHPITSTMARSTSF